MPTTTVSDTDARPDRRDGWDDRSDAALVSAVAERVAVPRRDPADSFVLHAPLEVLARAALLAEVAPGMRERARDRLVAIAAGVESWGPPIDRVGPAVRTDRFNSVPAAARWFGEAIAAGDLDAVDDGAAWLGRVARPAELRSVLADEVVPRLSAAAHGSILLYQLPRVSPRGRITGALLRGLARELAREPAWRIGWIDEARDAVDAGGPDASAEQLSGRLARAVDRGLGGSTFIRPTIDRVDSTGLAARLIGPLTPGEAQVAGPALLRVAARSMLLDRPDASPYGWTHCLTLPQAVLGVAGSMSDPVRAVQVAATHVLGFRSSLGDVPVDGPVELADPGIEVEEALAVGPAEAAGAVAHSPAPHDELVGTLATWASARHDAHQVKYTLACIDAAAADPGHARLHLCAAASLIGWWSRAGDPTDPFGPAAHELTPDRGAA